MKNLNVKDIIEIGALVLGGGIAWGALSTKVAAQDARIEQLAPVGTQMAVLREHIDAVDRRTTDVQIDVRALRSDLARLTRQLTQVNHFLPEDSLFPANRVRLTPSHQVVVP